MQEGMSALDIPSYFVLCVNYKISSRRATGAMS